MLMVRKTISTISELEELISFLKDFRDEVENLPETVEKIVTDCEKDTNINYELIAEMTTEYNPYGVSSSDKPSVVTHTKDGKSIYVNAKGEDTLYLEFGTGVYYNGDGSNYPEPRPTGVGGIGSQGYGLGKRKAWAFYADGIKQNWNKIITHGNKAYMPMYHMKQDITKKVNEHFKKLTEKYSND